MMALPGALRLPAGEASQDAWTPLAVATANGAGGAQTLHWLHSNHLGVPVGSYSSTGTATSLTTITLLGFPGQQQTLADLYYNQYRDYDPTTGRYLQTDPIGLAGDVNPYVYAGANPVGMVDPLGLDIAIIENGPTSGNPIGHTAIAVSHAGVYSFGNATRCGSSLSSYLLRESPRRHTIVYIIKTTPDQDAKILQYLKSHRTCNLGGGIWDILTDNCSVRSNLALDAAGIRVPYVPDMGRGGGRFPNIPGSAGERAEAYGADVVSIPSNSEEIPPGLEQFEPR